MSQSDDLQVETNKDRQLQRRVQSLQRFLMTRLKAELAQRALLQAPDQNQPTAKAAGKAAAGNFHTCSKCTPAHGPLQNLQLCRELICSHESTQSCGHLLAHTACKPYLLL